VDKDAFFERLHLLYDDSDFTLGFGDGPVKELGEMVASDCQRDFAVGVGSGTHALVMAAWALGLGTGDEVIVPANTFAATAIAPAMQGATIVPYDIDPYTLNISGETVADVFSDRVRAIFVVSMYGNPYPHDELEKFDVPIVEDTAHSHGATYRGRASGSFGLFGASSFYPTKVVGGTGDAGMILFDDPDMTPRIVAKIGPVSRLGRPPALAPTSERPSMTVDYVSIDPGHYGLDDLFG
jgi:dTDP-4-amino-4,6-dideoxygalactose transaminase